MARTPSLLKAALFITLLGFFLQLAAFVLPWWYVVGDTLYISIWYMLFCSNGIVNTANCTSFTFNAASGIGEASVQVNADAIVGLTIFTVIQVLVTVALGLVFLSSLGLIGSICADSRGMGCYGLTCFFLLLSSLTLLPVIGLFAFLQVVTVTTLQGYTLEARSFPWSVLFSGVGLLFTFIAFVTLAVALCRWRNIFDDDEEFDDAYHGDQGYLNMSNMNQKSGYDNPRYGPNDYRYPEYQQKNYSNDRSYPTQPYYGSSQKPAQPSSYPYNSDNLYRGYHKKY